MLKEFKDFALKGSLLDTAVAFVMGMAFGKVTTAFIDGLVMPLVSLIAGEDFSTWKTVLAQAIVGADGKEISPEIALKYGDFISAIIYFIIVAFVMFLIVKAITKAQKSEPAPAPAPPPAQEVLLSEIRDLLKFGR